MKAAHYFSFSALLITLSFQAQPTLKWAKSIAGPSYDGEYAVSIDIDGNVNATGTFKNTIDFDAGAGVFNQNSAGLGDVFITRYDAAGNFLWTKTLGSSGMDMGKAIASDDKGNLIVAGTFESTIDLDPGASVHNLGQPGHQNVFISKLDAKGNFVWGKNISSASRISCNNIVTDKNGNIYFTGSFKDQVDFDPGAGVYNLSTLGWMRDMYVTKLDASGNFLWARTIAVNCNDIGKSFGLDPSGNVYVSGSYYSTVPVDFDPTSGTHMVTPSSSEDVFLLKLDTDGLFVWVNHFSGSYYNGKTAIAIDDHANTYMAGTFHKTTDMDPGTGTFMLTATGNNPDAFVSKFDNNGNFLWAKQLGGNQADEASTVNISKNGEISITGMFTGTVDFDPGVGRFDMISAGEYDIFLSKLDNDGNFICGGNFGGPQTDRPGVVITDNENNLFVTGAYLSTADLDPGTGTYNVSPGIEPGVFICKLGECGGIISGSGENMSKELLFKIYPNPSHGQFIVTNIASSQNTQISIHNILGQEIFAGTLKAEENYFDLSDRPKGIYIITVLSLTGQQKEVKKIVIE